MPETPATFDAFVSYNSLDAELVGRYVRAMKLGRLNPWFDRDQIRPGRRTISALSDIEHCRAFVCMIGPHGLGNHQENEIAAAMELAKERGDWIYPVLLPGAEKSPTALSAIRYTDCRNDRDGKEFNVLLAWLQGNTEHAPLAATAADAAAAYVAEDQPESAKGRRHALIFSNTGFADASLQARHHVTDTHADRLEEVLKSDQYGMFDDVSICADYAKTPLIKSLRQKAEGCVKGDLALFVFTGVLAIESENAGDLLLLTSDSEKDFLEDTSVHLARIRKLVADHCVAQQKIVVFDCLCAGDVDAFRERIARMFGGIDDLCMFAGLAGVDAAGGDMPAPGVIAGVVAAIDGYTADHDRNGWITIEECFNHLAQSLPDAADRLAEVGIAANANWVISKGAHSDALQQHILPSEIEKSANDVIELIEQGEIIPFIGPGVKNLRLMSGTTFMDADPIEIERVVAARLLSAELAATDMERFSDVKDSLASVALACQYRIPERSRFIRKVQQNLAEEEPHETNFVYGWLARQSRPLLIVSLCYDGDLEKAFDRQGKKYVVVSHVVGENNGGSGSWNRVYVRFSNEDIGSIKPIDKLSVDLAEWSLIYKLQGCFGEHILAHGNKEAVDNLVISETDLIQLVSNISPLVDNIPPLIKSQIKRKPFLVFGFGLFNWSARAIYNAVVENVNNKARQDYVIRANPSAFERESWERSKAHLIEANTAEFLDLVSRKQAVDRETQH